MGPELPVWTLRVNTGNEVYSAAKVPLRVSSHSPPVLACNLWLNPDVFDLGVLQSVCCLVRGFLRPCHPPLWTAAPPPASPLATRPPPACSTGLCHCVVRPCVVLGIAVTTWYCRDTRGRLRLVKTLLAVRRRTMTFSNIFQTFTRDVALICWSCAAFHIAGY